MGYPDSPPHKTFTLSCIRDLLFTMPAFCQLYADLIEWLFTQAPPKLLEGFLGLKDLTKNEKAAFQCYFSDLLPNKCRRIA